MWLSCLRESLSPFGVIDKNVTSAMDERCGKQEFMEDFEGAEETDDI